MVALQTFLDTLKEKSRIQETPNLLTDADSSTNILFHHHQTAKNDKTAKTAKKCCNR